MKLQTRSKQKCVFKMNDDLGTHCTDIEYRGDAEAPTWLRFLNDVFGGDADLIDFVQRAVGYSLTGDVREQILMICHGSGSNGKSVFLNILRKLLGSLSWQAVPDLLLADKQRRHPTELADIFGKRLVICQETGDGRRFNETLVKQLTGGPLMSSYYHPKRDAGLKFYDYAATLEEVSRALGVSKERVRQIENRALAKARVILEARGYRLADLLEVGRG